MAATSSSSPMSVGTTSTEAQPRSSHFAAIFSSFSTVRATSTTWWPRWAASRAVASPMPLEAPVTRVTGAGVGWLIGGVLRVGGSGGR